MESKLKVGDKYSIIENGKRLIGRITQIDAYGYFVVIWSDGLETREENPSPMNYLRNS